MSSEDYSVLGQIVVGQDTSWRKGLYGSKTFSSCTPWGANTAGQIASVVASDPFVVELLHLPHWAEYASMAFFVVFVCGLSKWMLIRQKANFERQEER